MLILNRLLRTYLAIETRYYDGTLNLRVLAGRRARVLVVLTGRSFCYLFRVLVVFAYWCSVCRYLLVVCRQRLSNGNDALTRFTIGLSFSAVRFRSFPRVNRARTRTLRVVRVTHVCTMRLIRSLLRILLLRARAHVVSERVRVVLVVPYLRHSGRELFKFAMLRNVIRRVRGRVLRVRLVRVRHEICHLSVRMGLSSHVLCTRNREIDHVLGSFVRVRLLLLRRYLLTIRRARLRCLFCRRTRTLQFVVCRAARVLLRLLTLKGQ